MLNTYSESLCENFNTQFEISASLALSVIKANF